MPPPTPTTNVNNRRVSFLSCRLQLADAAGTFAVSGVKSFNYKHGLEPSEAEGNDAGSLGDTLGQYTASADLEQFFKNSHKLIARLGPGYMSKYFNLIVGWRDEDGGPLQTVKLYDCRLKNSAQDGSGADATTKKHELRVRLIEENDVLPYPGAQRQLTDD